MYPGSQEYEKILRLLPPHVWSAAKHLRAVSNLLERLGCHRHLRRADSMSRKHYRDLQNNPPQKDTSTNAAPLYQRSLRSQEKQALKIVRFQRHLPLTIEFYISCRISGVPPLQSDFSGLSSALKDDTNEPKKRKETRTKPTKMARKKSTLRTTTSTLLLHTLRTPTSATHSKEASL